VLIGHDILARVTELSVFVTSLPIRNLHSLPIIRYLFGKYIKRMTSDNVRHIKGMLGTSARQRLMAARVNNLIIIQRAHFV
jgi:hypothetical protein